MKKQIFTAVASLAVVAAMSVSAFAVESGSTNGSAEGKVEDGKVTLDNSVIVEGGFADGVEITVDVEPAGDVAKDIVAKAVTGAVANTVITITAESENVEVQPNGDVKITVAYDGVSNAALYVDKDGKAEELKLTVSDDKLTAEFTTSHFSTFYLVTLTDDPDAGNTNKPGSDDDNKGNPDTGVVLAVVPAVAAAAAIIVSKKRK